MLASVPLKNLSKDVAETKSDIKRIFMQDPAFNALDVQFLKQRGFLVLENFETEDKFPSDSFYFLPQATFGVIEGVLRTASPPLMIGNSLSLVSHIYVPGGKDVKAVFERYIRQSCCKPLPSSRLAPWLKHHFVYYRPRPDVIKQKPSVTP